MEWLEIATRVVTIGGALVCLIYWIGTLHARIGTAERDISRHEETCDERYRQIEQAHRDLRGCVDVYRQETREDFRSVHAKLDRMLLSYRRPDES
jgi:hypothetical protein